MKKLEKLVQMQKRISDANIQMVDLKFVDLIGKFRHVTLPARSMNEALLTEGVGFDGSSVGFKNVKSGDMCLIPDLDTAFIDPFWERSTISMICDIVEADSRLPFMGDPRSVAKRTLDYARTEKIADSVFLLPELEFNLMDKVSYDVSPHRSFFDIESSERSGLSDDETNPLSGHWIPVQQGYHRAPPQDFYRDIRAEVVEHLESIGIDVKYHHHEVGATGQQEIELTLAPMMDACDRTMLAKYFVHNVAIGNGVTATFMPKPIAGEAGNGLHMHLRLTDKNGGPLFFDENDPSGLSDTAHCFIGGIIRHGRSLAAFTNPSTNSYRRLIPGFEAPTNLFFSMGSRNSAIRIPKYANSPDKKRFEIRSPDATCNIYFAASAIVMAGLDGVQKGIHAGKNGWGPFNDIRLEPRAIQRKIPSLPGSLEEALSALEKDHSYLRENDVFSQQLIDGWITSRRQREIIPTQQTPTPLEFQLYFSC
ncbi:type I glutamate--ammonia ligase [bacterium]|nr:type I glutamate--ammonia ligase [candidate division CSSED10-310 bacterium]